jgi:glucose/arabinose dehydrogenase
MHSFVIDADGKLYVVLATATNSCQVRNRTRDSPGISPCVELTNRGGIWRYDANKLGQKFSPLERYATGIRNAEGIALDAGGKQVWATQHGRDQLYQNWPALYKPVEEATQPAEELLKVQEGGDYGWP